MNETSITAEFTIHANILRISRKHAPGTKVKVRAHACVPMNETLVKRTRRSFSNVFLWRRIVLLQFASKYLSQMISESQVQLHQILAARCRRARNLFPEFSELTLPGVDGCSRGYPTLPLRNTLEHPKSTTEGVFRRRPAHLSDSHNCGSRTYGPEP